MMNHEWPTQGVKGREWDVDASTEIHIQKNSFMPQYKYGPQPWKQQIKDRQTNAQLQHNVWLYY